MLRLHEISCWITLREPMSRKQAAGLPNVLLFIPLVCNRRGSKDTAKQLSAQGQAFNQEMKRLHLEVCSHDSRSCVSCGDVL
jgi:hypothetical protein